MRAKSDSFNIVLLGSWNRAIFKPDWLLKNVCSQGTQDVSVAFPTDDPAAPWKIVFEDVMLFPGSRQLTVVSKSLTRNGINKCEEVLSKIVALLIHTPVTNCGINFSFSETVQTRSVFSALEAQDRNVINQGDGYTIANSNLTRRIRCKDDVTLNLALSDAEGVATIGFNFHYELNDIGKYGAMFRGGEAGRRFDEAIDFCQRVYGLELNEDIDQ